MSGHRLTVPARLSLDPQDDVLQIVPRDRGSYEVMRSALSLCYPEGMRLELYRDAVDQGAVDERVRFGREEAHAIAAALTRIGDASAGEAVRRAADRLRRPDTRDRVDELLAEALEASDAKTAVKKLVLAIRYMRK